MKLVVLEPLGVTKERLTEIAQSTLGDCIEVIYYQNRVEDIPTLIERSREADIVMLSNFNYPKEVIEACKRLKMICVAFTGFDHVDIAYCNEREITVCNCAGYSTVAVADLVFGLIFNLYRNIIPCNQVVRQSGTKEGLVGYELEGKKFGIIGTGAIGSRVAHIAQAFGCKVYAYSRTPKEEKGIEYVDLDTLLEISDIISLHVPLNEQTQGMINAKRLGRMKEDAILINTARGPVVDYEALAEALRVGKIAGAGIDVFEMEPPVPQDHPLFNVQNVVVTPHVAFATKEALDKRAIIAFDNVKYWHQGKTQNQVNNK